MLKQILRATAVAATAAVFAGCSGGHGFLGTDYLPKGDIVITDNASGTPIASSIGMPFVDGAPGFTIGIAETNFDGPYGVVITSWHNGFNKPCFVPHSLDPQGHVNKWLFSADNANAPGTPTTQANPCVSDHSDEETAQITDGKGHTANLYFTY